MNVNEPLSVPNVSSPPPLPPRRKLPLIPPPPPPIFPGPASGGLGDPSQNEAMSLSNLEDAEEDTLTAKQLRKLYDNDEIDRFLTLFSDVCNYPSYSQTALIGVGSM
jgi:hypothetical protein